MGIRKAFKARFSEDLDPAAVDLRREVRTIWADAAEAKKDYEEEYDYIVMEVDENQDVYPDKSGGALERTKLVLRVVTARSVARCERLLRLTRRCFEAVKRPGGCTLRIDRRCFVSLHYKGSTVRPSKDFPNRTVGHVEYWVDAYRSPEETACSSSSSSDSTSSSSGP